jgi:hypothetical protein
MPCLKLKGHNKPLNFQAGTVIGAGLKVGLEFLDPGQCRFQSGPDAGSNPSGRVSVSHILSQTGIGCGNDCCLTEFSGNGFYYDSLIAVQVLPESLSFKTAYAIIYNNEHETLLRVSIDSL